MRFKLLIEYAGTRYSGWQIQKNARTVQGEIDRAVARRRGRREFELYGSGRTDAGVHALAQVAHLELYTDLAAGAAAPQDQRRAARRHPHPGDRQGAAPLPRAARRRSRQLPLSDLAPPHGVRQAVRLVDPGAARRGRDARGGGRVRRHAGLRGLHRRRSRREVDARAASSGVEIAESRRAASCMRVQGSHFLWKMVRRMVGVLAAVGRGEIAAADAGDAFSGASTPGPPSTPRRWRRRPPGCSSRRALRRGRRAGSARADGPQSIERAVRCSDQRAAATSAQRMMRDGFAAGSAAVPCRRQPSWIDLEVVGGQRRERGVQHVVVPPRVHRAR